MLRKTHIAIGMSSALAITHPTTVSGVATALIGGSLGGWIVDIDCKNTDVDREDVYDAIIDVLFIGTFIVLDYFVGNGMCQYISENLGIRLLAVTICFIGLMIIGFKTTHRSFTHSFLGWLLYGMIMFILCRPIAIPFMAGYLSHIIVDLFNKKGEQLFFPLKTRFCFRLCDSDGTANKTLFWIAFILGVILGAFFLSQAMISAWDSSAFINKVLATKLLGLNALQIYLIFINIITFLGFQRSWKLKDREQLSKTDKAVKVQSEFETWLIDILVFLGGGVGMLFSLIIHLQYPAAYNGNWWCFCYSSILLWGTVYCYVCNPFGYNLKSINWLSLQHIPLLMYVIAINTISALLTYFFRKKHLNEYRVEHTLLLLIGAFGGTIGGFISTIVVHRDRSFNYEVIGFPIMLISQIIFTMYMMSAGVI